jgi:hypothetical protein
VSSSIKFTLLPLHTRTRNCLEKEGLLSADVLQKQSLEKLLAIPAFGVKCLVDLLTAVEAVNQVAEVDAAGAASPKPVLPELQVVTLLPRLTREARLLGNEPWAKEVSLYDIRLGARLLRDEQSLMDIRNALAAGRIPLEERLCPDPPCRDLDLLRCPLLTYTKNCLREADLTTLSAVAPLKVREARELPGLGERALADLLTVLDACRFLALAAGPTAHEPTLAEFCEAVVNRDRDAWFPERLADRIHHTRVVGIRCLALRLEEELHELAGACSVRPDVVMEYLGWDGGSPRTLEAVGALRGLTRERVRQIVTHTTARLSGAITWTPILRQALDACGSACPRAAEQVAAFLQEKGLATAPFHPQGLLTAAEAFGLTHAFSLGSFGETDWLFKQNEESLLRKGLELARSAVATRGACSLGDLQARLVEHTQEDLTEDTLRELIDRLPNVSWLDEDRQWFRFRTGGSSLETILWKILAVAPEIQLGELREGLTRHYRSPSAPPSAVLRQLCRQLALQVDGNIVRVQQAVCPKEVLSEVEFTFFDILRAEGPLLPTIDLEKRCLQRGMNRNTFWVYLTYSPILAQYATGVFGLRGSQVAPGEAEMLRPPLGRSRVVEDYGWKKGGGAWIAYTITDGLLRCGVAGLPAGLRDALGDGSWTLFTADGAPVGTLVCRRGSVWGFKAYFTRRGADVGDTLVLEIDRKAGAKVRVGSPDLIEQIRGALPITSCSDENCTEHSGRQEVW